MRASALLLLLSTAAASTAAAQKQVPRLDWGEFRWERDRGTTTGIVPATPDSAYRLLHQVMKDLGLEIKPEDDDPVHHEFLVRRQRLVGRLGKSPVSKYLSCGDGLTGPNADLWHVFLTIHSVVSPGPAGKSTVQMGLSAEAVDVPGGRSDRVACSSTGNLELEIVRRLR